MPLCGINNGRFLKLLLFPKCSFVICFEGRACVCECGCVSGWGFVKWVRGRWLVKGGWEGWWGWGGLLAHLESFSNYTISQECRPAALVFVLLPTSDSKCPRLTLYLSVSFSLVKEYINRCRSNKNKQTRKTTEVIHNCGVKVKVASAHSPGRRWLERPVSQRSGASKHWPSLWIRLRVNNHDPPLWF